MKFKCNISGCVYNFESELDIKAMKLSQDYTVVKDAPEAEKEPVKAVTQPTTIVQVEPIEPAPDKPLPVAAKAPKAV